MILTKEEFKKEYKYNSSQAVCRLIREKKIKLNAEGLIDTNENGDFCRKRKEKLNKPAKKETATTTKPQEQLSLEMDMLNSRLDERRGRAELLQLKIAKEKGSVVETNVLNNIIRLTFEDMIKTLMEFPNIYAMEIINMVHAEENPKEVLVEYLTNKMNEAIKMGLNNAKQAARKYYKD